MFQKLDCIALRTVKYSDRNSILTVYTRQEGRLSVLVPAGHGREANRIRALLMPLGRFECVADIRPGREIHNIRDVRPSVLPAVGDPARSTVSLFIADLLSGLLKEPMPDPLLFDFFHNSILALNSPLSTKAGGKPNLNGIANFHIAFLIMLSRFLGIEPDWGSHAEGSVFDMKEGVFRASPPLHRDFLGSADADKLYQLHRINYRNMHLFQMSRFERNQLLDLILHYYRLHYPSLPALTSLPVLRLLAD